MAFTFTVNHLTVTCNEDKDLLSFLRDDLRLTSAKDGCSQGACGTCTVLVDGKAVRACLQKLSRLESKSILTCEGLSAREQEVYSYAFSTCGAVQCGFCIPGMVMAAKALIDQTPNPTQVEIKRAIRGNICRCTGYVKIVKAITLAAKLLREAAIVPDMLTSATVGSSLPRVDAPAKALGLSQYTNDIFLPTMLYGGALRSAHPHATILEIDVSKAIRHPDTVCILTAKDLKGSQKIGHIKKDQWVLVPEGANTCYLGDAVALIASRTRESLEEIRALIDVKYNSITPTLSLDEAKKHNNNILSREQLRRGSPDEKLQESAHVVNYSFETPPTEHAFLELESAVATWDGTELTVYCGDQGIYQTQHEISECTGLPAERIRVIAQAVGGGFGGKEDLSVQHHAALLAMHCGAPVNFTLTRDESILVHPKRHAMQLDFTLGCDKNGILTALKAKIYSDTGAFASLGGPVLQRACTHAAGPYNYHDIDIEGIAYYTNNPPAGAFRGFGVTQSCFAIEQCINMLAEQVGISPFEIRLRNAIRPGQILPNGQIADESTALYETLMAVQPYYDRNPQAGIACAMKNSGIGVGLADIGRCKLLIEDGYVNIYSSAACIGQGLGTILIQITCEALNLDSKFVRYHAPDTAFSPNSGNTTASRQTLFTGEATRRAAIQLRNALVNASLQELEGKSFLGEYSGVTDGMNSDKENPVSHVAYGYATHLVTLTSDGNIEQVVAAHDVGRAINPTLLEGQIEGGVVMGLGYALTENFPLENGKPLAKFGTLGLFRADAVPTITPVIIEKSKDGLAFGAKGVGEICTIPTAPAVALAYYNRDKRFQTKLPLANTPYDRTKQ